MWILTIFRIKRFHIKMYILKRDTKQKQENLEPRNSHPSLLPTCYDLSRSWTSVLAYLLCWLDRLPPLPKPPVLSSVNILYPQRVVNIQFEHPNKVLCHGIIKNRDLLICLKKKKNLSWNMIINDLANITKTIPYISFPWRWFQCYKN